MNRSALQRLLNCTNPTTLSYVRPIAYRALRIYMDDEVKRPCFDTLIGNRELSSFSSSAEALQILTCTAAITNRPGLGQVPGDPSASATSGGLNL